MSEELELKHIGATPVKNSGRGFHKGDGILNPFLIDVKEYSKGFTVTQSNWRKISTDALKNGKRIPALRLVLGDERKTRLWVVDDTIFEEMRLAWLEKHGD